MSRGLKLTLMTVAVAILAAKAMAMAPVIGDIPSPVVGDAENATPANYFVYPNAFRLSDYVTDDSSPSSAIIWSFQTATTSKYSINGHGPLNMGAGQDEINPGTAAINTSIVGGEDHVGTDPAWLTIRNVHLTPLVGQAGTNPGANGASGAIDSETQIVTLFASDGSTASQKNVWFYTTHGNDHLSGITWTSVDHRTFPSNSSGFVWTAASGAVTSSVGANGICIQVAPPGGSTGKWQGPYGMLPLVKNAVYRIRANIVGSQAASTTNDVPFWDMIVGNFDRNNTGENLYGMNFFFFDNLARADAAIAQAGGKKFQAFWCPSPVSTAQWNDPTTGIYNTANAAVRDGYIEFRILDSGAGSNVATGSLCMQDLVIDRIDAAFLNNIAATPYNPASLTSSNSLVTGTGYTGAYDANGVTLTPTAAGQTSALTEFWPGNHPVDFTNINSIPDNFPVPLAPKTLYLITFTIDAPTATDAAGPPGVFWIGADIPDNELICLSWISGSGLNTAGTGFAQIGMPKTTAQPYKALFWSNYGYTVNGAAAPAILNAFRPRFMCGNSSSLPFNTNNGKIRIRSMKVDQISYTDPVF